MSGEGKLPPASGRTVSIVATRQWGKRASLEALRDQVGAHAPDPSDPASVRAKGEAFLELHRAQEAEGRRVSAWADEIGEAYVKLAEAMEAPEP